MTLSYSLATHEVTSPKGVRNVLIATPDSTPVLGPNSFLEHFPSPFSNLASTVCDAGKSAPIVVVRFAAAGQPWAIPELPRLDLEHMGQGIVRALLREVRTLAAAGTLALVCAELRAPVSTMLQNGIQDVARELRMRSRSDGSIANDNEEALRQLDAWLLKYALFIYEQSVEQVLREESGDMVPMLERRSKVLRLLLKGAGIEPTGAP